MGDDDKQDQTFRRMSQRLMSFSYVDRLNKDFDQKKTYDETVLKIVNEYSRTP
jgi:hypothetical protein